MRSTWLLILISCSGLADSTPGAEAPVCDGRLQEGEIVVDGPWDRDRDGHFDFDDFGCSGTYGLNRFDCDDTNASVNASMVEILCNGIDDDCSFETPDGADVDDDGATDCIDCDDTDDARSPDFAEICWDEIDNDCDGTADEDCGPDYNGLFVLTDPVIFACAAGAVVIEITEIQVTWAPPVLTIEPSSVLPFFALIGTIASDGTFAAEAEIQNGCNQQYRIDGVFTGEDSVVATFRARWGSLTCSACPRELDDTFTADRLDPYATTEG